MLLMVLLCAVKLLCICTPVPHLIRVPEMRPEVSWGSLVNMTSMALVHCRGKSSNFAMELPQSYSKPPIAQQQFRIPPPPPPPLPPAHPPSHTHRHTHKHMHTPNHSISMANGGKISKISNTTLIVNGVCRFIVNMFECGGITLTKYKRTHIRDLR